MAFETQDKTKWNTVFLLGLFALGIVLSQMYVMARSRVEMSEPVPLDFAGLRAAVPVGSGWIQTDQWEYSESAQGFALQSQQVVGARRQALVSCFYLLAGEGRTPQERLEIEAGLENARIARSGSESVGSLTLEWGLIENPESGAVFYSGYARMAGGHFLKVYSRVLQDALMSRKLFFETVNMLDYQPTGLPDLGADFNEHFRNLGLDRLTGLGAEDTYEQIYLVRGANDEEMGFWYVENGSIALGLRIKQRYYARRDFGILDSQDLFETDISMTDYLWQSRKVRQAGVGNLQTADSIRLETGPEGGISIWSEQGGRPFTLWPSPLTVPEPVVHLAWQAMIDYRHDEVMVDLLLPNGFLLPVQFSKINPSDMEIQIPDTAYVVETRWLDGSGYYSQSALNADGELIGIYYDMDRIRVVEKSSYEELLRYFPDEMEQHVPLEEMQDL